MSLATLGFSAIQTIILIFSFSRQKYKKKLKFFTSDDGLLKYFLNFVDSKEYIQKMKIGLFVPCYVDALYPEVAVATYKLLKYYGLDVTYPERQTCCGQPMANAGFERMSKHLINSYDELFKDFDYVVAPSASCASYIRFYYPSIMEREHHECIAPKKTTDIVEFLHDVLKVDHVPGKFPHVVSVHNSCHGVRELGLSAPSERGIAPFNKIVDLLNMVEGITVKEPERKDECCGFGGMFSVEEPAVSTRMGENKIARHLATGAEYVTGADSSCLMHMEGIARREKTPIKFIHVAQILAAGL